MSKLDDILDEPMTFIEAQMGDEEVRERTKQQIKDLMRQTIGAYSDYASTETDKYADGYNQGIADLILELKAKVEEL